MFFHVIGIDSLPFNFDALIVQIYFVASVSNDAGIDVENCVLPGKLMEGHLNL